MRLARLLVAAAILSTMFVWSTPPAGACSCEQLTDQQAYDAADAVFEATVTQLDRTEGSPVAATFAVDHVYKGRVRQTQLVYTPDDTEACGVEFDVGLGYVVFANVIDGSEGIPGYPIGDLRSGFCDGSRGATATGLELDPPVEPVAPIADAPTTTTTLVRPTTGAEEIAEPLTGGGVFVVGFIAVGIVGAFIASRIAKRSRES